jgi:hypothetical protein
MLSLTGMTFFSSRAKAFDPKHSMGIHTETLEEKALVWVHLHCPFTIFLIKSEVSRSQLGLI